jgi:hypothetical protein
MPEVDRNTIRIYTVFAAILIRCKSTRITLGDSEAILIRCKSTMLNVYSL